MEYEFLEILHHIVCKILNPETNPEEIQILVRDKLESKCIWDTDNLLITDCYYALKHMYKEEILLTEWVYFRECFEGERNYDLHEKMNYILEKTVSPNNL